MKKIILLAFAIFNFQFSIFNSGGAFANWNGTVATGYAGGDGTKSNPYQIASCEQFAYFAQCVNNGDNYSRGKYFTLTTDLTFNENVMNTANATLKEGKAFRISPTIGSYTNYSTYTPFQGVFDGGQHTISGLYYVDWGNAFTMFKAIDGATIKNLRIKDSYIYSGSNLGFIAAAVFDSKIINCDVTDSEIDSWASTSGAICGVTYKTVRIQNCHTAITMNVKNNSGGICGMAGKNGTGYTDDVMVENCYTNCTMTYTKTDKMAGIAYYMYANSTIKDNWYSGNTTVAYGSNAYSDGLDKEENNNLVTDISTTITALNNKAAFIPGACRWNTDGSLDYTTFTTEEDTEDVNARATDPVPSDGDYHYEATDGKIVLSWKASADGLTSKQNLYLGSSKEEVEAMTTPTATFGTETSYTLSDLDCTKKYYWRIDRVTAEGKATQGDVWSFQMAHLAFPGAGGYGRFAHGGRGGKVVYVTNLNDDGKEGSLRWALTNGEGPRTVMFRVAGIIDMQFKTCKVDDDVTIAAQTAPGKGICIKHSDIALGADNICRFLRARRGLGAIDATTGLSDDTGNAMGMNGDNSIMDHVSLSWGTDETFSSRNARDITFQRSMIAEALGIAGHRNYAVGTNHGYAATIGGDIGSFSHNFLVDCYGRNWSMGGGTDASGAYAGRLDMFNNVCYNWGHRATDGGAKEVNFIGNYYKEGPATNLKCIFKLQIEGDLKGTQAAYVSGNVRDNYDGSITQDKENDTFLADVTSSRTTPVTWDLFVNTPFFGGEHHATVEKAEDAYKSVLSDNGANQPCLDDHDKRMVKEALNRSYTYTGSKSGIKGQIDNETDCGGFEDYPETTWPDDYDSDNNGLPQWWEKITGETDPNHFTASGYTALEDYLNFLASPHYTLAQNEETSVDLKSLFAGYTKSPKFTVEDANTSLVNTTINGSTMNMKAVGSNSVTSFRVKVTDSEGSTYSRTFNIALTDAASAVERVSCNHQPSNYNVYSLDGKNMGKSVDSLSPDLYIIKTNAGNKIHRIGK